MSKRGGFPGMGGFGGMNINQLMKEAKKMQSDMEKSQEELVAKESWGDTEAYKEYEQKSSGKNDTDMQRDAEGLMDIFYEFGDMKDKDVNDSGVQALVIKLQQYITDHYYKCTDQILLSLAQMYTAGGEMTANIDAAGGKGCAEFVRKAIEARG